jgi:hypothetical protein
LGCEKVRPAEGGQGRGRGKCMGHGSSIRGKADAGARTRKRATGPAAGRRSASGWGDRTPGGAGRIQTRVGVSSATREREGVREGKGKDRHHAPPAENRAESRPSTAHRPRSAPAFNPGMNISTQRAQRTQRQEEGEGKEGTLGSSCRDSCDRGPVTG